MGKKTKDEEPRTVPGKNGGTLQPWNTGQSGNPKGMPKGYKSFKRLISEASLEKVDWRKISSKKNMAGKHPTESMTAGQAVVVSLFANAIYQGDVHAAKVLMEQADGTDANVILKGDPKNPINHTTTTSVEELDSLSHEKLTKLAKAAQQAARELAD